MSSKVVLVTGASSGLGKSISLALSREGHTVYGVCRSAESYPEITEFELLSMDVTDKQQITAVLDLIMEREGRLDVVVNNAGKGITGPVETTPIEEIRRVFELNLYGPIQVIQGALPLMRKSGSGGYVVNVGSIGGYMGLPFRGIYSASKSALSMVTESLRLECEESGIQFCTIDPGDFKSDIRKRRYHSPNEPDSPYYVTYGRMLETIDSDVDSGSSPEDLSRELLNILKSKSLKPHYPLGAPLQRFSIRLKGLLPSKIYERLLKKHYKL